MKKAAIYIRVSTDTQAEEGYSIDAQKERLKAYCISKGIKNYEFYIDGGFSGSNLDRPEIKRLISDAKAGKLSHVIVYKLDRLSRSQKDTLYIIEDVFNPNKIDFVSINESMDTSTPMGRLMLGILSAFAQLERENIRERTRMGMKERVKSGLWMGGGRIPFGYDYDKEKGILVPNKDAETVRKIYSLYQEGYSAEKIASILGLKYDRLVMQILKRKSNAGYIQYNGEEYKGLHEPIISEEEYQRTMVMIEKRSGLKASFSDHLLTGIVYCGKCGAKMRYQKWGKRGFKLVCYSQQNYKPYLVKDSNCDNIRPWANELEDIVIQDIFRLSIEKTKLSDTNMPSPVSMLEEQLELELKKLKKLYTVFSEDDDDALIDAINDIKNKIKRIKKDIEREKQFSINADIQNKVIKSIEGIGDVWDNLTPSEKKTIIRSVVKKIIVDGDNVNIEYVL